MKQGLLTYLFILILTFNSFCQVKEFNLVEKIKSQDTAINIVYLNATWCHPCMEKLEDIVKNFGADKSVKLTVLFDRYGFEKYQSRLFQNYDSSYFRLFQSKYYKDSKGIINISINAQKKMFNRFLQDYNRQLSTNLTLNELWFGHAIIFKGAEKYITTNMGKAELIEEISNRLKNFK